MHGVNASCLRAPNSAQLPSPSYSYRRTPNPKNFWGSRVFPLLLHRCMLVANSSYMSGDQFYGETQCDITLHERLCYPWKVRTAASCYEVAKYTILASLLCPLATGR